MTSRYRICHAARVAAVGGIIAYPTEAVYGLGCNPFDIAALEQLHLIKQRDAGKGLIVVAANTSQLAAVAELPGGNAGERIRASWPGPVTWIVRAQRDTPVLLTGGRSTIAVRVSAHPLVQRLCLAFGGALVSTSANLSSRKPARNALQVRRQLGELVDFMLAGPLGDSAQPTEIRDAASGVVLRRGNTGS